MISYAGLAFACLAALCFAAGAGHAPPWEARGTNTPISLWPLSGGLFLTVAGVLDLLDGAVARNGNLQTRFGGVLDSTLDRFGDMAVLIGCSVYYAREANVTYVLLSGVALIATVQISYVKARAESFVSGMGVGFWQRAERTVALILGGVFGHVPAVLWILAVLPMFTVLRRIRQAWHLLGDDDSESSSSTDSFVWPWRRPRGSAGYVLVCLLIASFIATAPQIASVFRGNTDPLRVIVGS